MKKTVLWTLIALVLLLLVSRLVYWRHDPLPHASPKWKEVSFTRIKPMKRLDNPEESGQVPPVQVLKPEHPGNDDSAHSK